jgi:hypothetical protein
MLGSQRMGDYGGEGGGGRPGERVEDSLVGAAWFSSSRASRNGIDLSPLGVHLTIVSITGSQYQVTTALLPV